MLKIIFFSLFLLKKSVNNMTFIMRRFDFVVIFTYFVLEIDATCYLLNNTVSDWENQFFDNIVNEIQDMCCNTQNTTILSYCIKDKFFILYENDFLWRDTYIDFTWKDSVCFYICTIEQDKKFQQWCSTLYFTFISNSNETNYVNIVTKLITCVDRIWCCKFQYEKYLYCNNDKEYTVINKKIITFQTNLSTSSNIFKNSTFTI